MATLNQLLKGEYETIRDFKPVPCVVCGTTKRCQRWTTTEGIVCQDCYLKAITIGIKALKAHTEEAKSWGRTLTVE